MNDKRESFTGLNLIKEVLYDQAGLLFDRFIEHREGGDYAACSFELNGLRVEHRSARITPTKQGLFVTIWKRNKEGITAPMDVSDNFDLLLITCMQNDRVGQFVFSKPLLVMQKVISVNCKAGKRGMRVYPPWEIPSNDQAKKTQKWQRDHFIDRHEPMAMEKLRYILRQLNQAGSSSK
jgi:hypothetical protein